MANRKPLTEEEKEKKKLERAAAKHCKSVVFKLEKDNHKHLYAFKSTDDWYKLGGHSALFYKYRVAPRLKIKCDLKVDRDFYYNFKDGIIPIKNIEKFEEHLKPLRIFKKGIEPEYIVFDLQGEISDEQIKEMRNIEKDSLRQINKIINPGDVLPRTLVLARLVQKDLFETCRKVDGPTRELIGRDTVYLAIRIMDNVLRTCRGKLAAEKLRPSVENDATLLMSRVTMMIDEKRIELPAGVRIMQHLDTLERAMAEEIGVLKKKAEKEAIKSEKA